MAALEPILDDVFTALREGAGGNLPIDDLELPPKLTCFLQGAVAALALDVPTRAKRVPAARALFGDKPATLTAARKDYRTSLTVVADDDLRWLAIALRTAVERELGQAYDGDAVLVWDAAVGPPSPIDALPDQAAEAALVLVLLDVVMGELARRNLDVEAPPAPDVVETIWRDGQAVPITAADVAEAERMQAMALAMLLGFAVCGLEVWLLTLDWGDQVRLVRGRPVHAPGAPLMRSFPALVTGGAVGALAGRALYVACLRPGPQAALARWRNRLPTLRRSPEFHAHYVPTSMGGGFAFGHGVPTGRDLITWLVVAVGLGFIYATIGFVHRHTGLIALGVAGASLAAFLWTGRHVASNGAHGTGAARRTPRPSGPPPRRARPPRPDR